MAHHEQPAALDLNDPRIKFDGGGKLVVIGGVLAVVGLGGGAAVGAGMGDHFSHFLHSYLVAYCYFLAIMLGCLFFVTLQHLTKAGWSSSLRRLPEIIAGGMPIFAVLSLPIVLSAVMGSHALYEWADHSIVEKDHLLEHKAPYLNPTFFGIRCLIYFVFWSVLARFMLKLSSKQDETGDPKLTIRREKIAPVAMIVFALTLSYAAVDLIMTLDPHWYSTIIGVYYFAGCVMSSAAVIILLAKYLQSKGKLTQIVSTEHFHDLGKWMFGFVFFWAYIAFSQFMLIWYANMPEGTAWYQSRWYGAWEPFSIALILGHFAIPFVGLMSRHVKRKTNILAFWAVWLLVAHWIDMYYLIAPTMITHGHGDKMSLNLALTDPLCWVGMFGAFLLVVGLGLKKHRLVAVRDPRLHEALAFENF